MMINSFKKYLKESENTVYVTFSNMSIPNISYGELLESLQIAAKKKPYKAYLSQSKDNSKNPLNQKSKVKYARKMFPKHSRQIHSDKNIKNIKDVLTAMYSEGYSKIVVMVGEERVNECQILLDKYNGENGRHGFYIFESIEVVSSGMPDPDLNDTKKVLEYIENNDFSNYSQVLGTDLSNNDARRLFNEARRGLGLKELSEFKTNVKFEPVSETREKFVEGDLFNIGEQVIVKSTDEVGEITFLGSNYVIVETSERKTRQWIDAVEKIEDQPEWGTPKSTKKAKKMTPGQNEERTPQDPDIDDRKGTQPKRYHAGLAKATKIARDRQFKKQSKMADDDPKAYKPAPGDKTAKTKPSKHTKFVKKMMGEQSIERAKERIARDVEREKAQDRKEKEQMKKKHDRIMDRARRSKMLQRNKGVSND